MKRFGRYTEAGVFLGTLLFALVCTICGFLELVGIHAFDLILNTLGRVGIIAIGVAFCLLIAISSVFSEDGFDMAIPKSVWGWIKLVALILLLTTLWFSGCLARPRYYP